MALVTTRMRNVVYTHSFRSPVGMLHGAVDRFGKVLYLGLRPSSAFPPDLRVYENKYACGELEYQIEQYFAGERREFSLELGMDGTSFQRAVWNRLTKLGYGETVSYGQIARRIGRADAARAVGNAVAANRILIIVPCHRVLPAAGGVGNYALRGTDAREGSRIKRALLDLEGALTVATSSRASA